MHNEIVHVVDQKLWKKIKKYSQKHAVKQWLNTQQCNQFQTELNTFAGVDAI